MSILYRLPGEPRKMRCNILSIPPNRLVRILGGPKDHVQVYLHWVGAYSVPCLGDQCELCETPPFLFGYAGVANYEKRNDGTYASYHAILPVTEGIISLIEHDRGTAAFAIARKRGLYNGPMEWEKIKYPMSTELQPFDVKPRLECLWRLRSRTKLGKAPADEPNARDDVRSPVLYAM